MLTRNVFIAQVAWPVLFKQAGQLERPERAQDIQPNDATLYIVTIDMHLCNTCHLLYWDISMQVDFLHYPFTNWNNCYV